MFHLLKSYTLLDTFLSKSKTRRDLKCVGMGEQRTRIA